MSETAREICRQLAEMGVSPEQAAAHLRWLEVNGGDKDAVSARVVALMNGDAKASG